MDKNSGGILEDPNKIIIGLALLEPELRGRFEQANELSQIIDNLNEPLDNVLTPRGMSLFINNSDSVPNLTDEPLDEIADDLLGRVAFARYLVKRITTTEFTSGAYSIHLSGPWGSGKSTILNFVKRELESVKETDNSENKNNIVWLVAEFNAWRHQHIDPPWWPLYVQMYGKIKEKLGIWPKIREWYWRMSARQLNYIFIFILAFCFLAIFINYLGVEKIGKWAKPAENISKIIALISTVAGGIFAIAQSLHFGSARTAKSFEESVQDPMNTIRKRFGNLLDNLPSNVRLLVSIDDLDRCKSEYVVSLLEGIQTLFRQGNIVFIIAADKKWINACFEERYSSLREFIKEPAKPLGTLFLEKTFQLCTPVPGIPQELKNEFWQKIISLKTNKVLSEMEKAGEKVRNEMNATKEESAIIKKVKESKRMPIHEQLAIRAEAVVQLASSSVIERTGHTLKHFAPLLDDNPRSMKRFVNAYSVNRAHSTLSFSDIELNDLAQWTIFAMRWPLLAEHVSKNPSILDKIKKNDLQGLDDDIKIILKDKEIVKILKGGGITGDMDERTIIACMDLI